MDKLLLRSSLRRTLRVGAWVARFLRNSKSPTNQRIKGSLNTEEINKQSLFWEKNAQKQWEGSDQFQEDQLRLKLQPNRKEVLECRGRIQGNYPVYLLDSALCTLKFVQHAHEITLHGEEGLAMAKVRDSHWIPRLRKLVKRVIKQCYGCKRFQITAFSNPPQGNLPRDRTEGNLPFQVVGVDYAGPIKYRTSKNREGKAYIVLYACSLTLALYLELTKTLETNEFISTVKRLIARNGRPEKIYSDNGKTFLAAAKWLRKVMKDERLHNFLGKVDVKWQFNLSRAPWWGGHFERMVGLVKRAFHKTVGNGMLTWGELQDVLPDVEVTMNKRPLSYIEEDIQLPILTSNLLQFGCPNLLPETQSHQWEKQDLRRRERYLKKCKDVLWGRWSSEYLRGLREQHNLKHKGCKVALAKASHVALFSTLLTLFLLTC